MSGLRLRLAGAALAGGAMALAQPPLGLWPALFAAGPFLHLLWARAETVRAAFLTGWAAGAAFFGLALHWIVEPFLVDAARHGWMAPFALLLMAGGLALFWGAGFALAAALRRFGGGPFLLAAAWALMEFARSYVLTGFPWALPAYAWMETPLLQSAALIGPYGLSLLTLAALLAPGALLEWKRRALPALLCLPALAGLWLWGAARIPEAEAADASRPLVRILRTDIDQNEKWAPENARLFFERLLALSEGGAEPPAIVLWPEAAISFPIDMAPEAQAMIGRALGPAALGLGSLRLDAGPEGLIEAGALWRNSFFLMDGRGLSAPYDKVHLVPFGEYLPFDAAMAAIGLKSLAGLGAGIVPGAAPALMRAPGLPPFAPLICYEMIFPRETARAAAGAEWLVLVTNDGWFGAWAGPRQHFEKARMRAVETGLPVARAANRGISAMIDPWGRAEEAAAGERALDARLPDSLPPPPYARRGETYTTLAIILLCMLSTQSRRRRVD